MAANRSVLVLPGDGIGPEVMAQVQRVIGWFDAKGGVRFDGTEDLAGGAGYDAHGVSIRDETMEIALSTDAVLFGAVGGILVVIWPLHPVLLSLAPIGALLAAAAWLLVVSRMRSYGPEDLLLRVAEIAESPPVDS